MLIRTIATVSLVAIVLSSTEPPTSQPESSLAVSWSDLGNNVHVIGCCGKPMGQLITVEGELIDPATIQSKLDSSATLFRADKVDGETLRKAAPLRLSEEFGGRRKLELGHRYRLVGWEDGGFIGLPDDANDFMNEHKMPMPATTGWFFLPRFSVLETVEIPQAKSR
jgi:hypothetical protein